MEFSKCKVTDTSLPKFERNEKVWWHDGRKAHSGTVIKTGSFSSAYLVKVDGKEKINTRLFEHWMFASKEELARSVEAEMSEVQARIIKLQGEVATLKKIVSSLKV